MGNKIAIVGDPHIGKKSIEQVKKDKLLFSQEIFFNNFYNFCIENDINEIIWTGDIFDTNQAIDSFILQYVVELFKIKFGAMRHYVILGNHCLYNKDSLKVSALSCIEHLPNVNVYRKPTKVNLLGHNFLFVPYLVSSIYSKFSDNIKKLGSLNEIIVGHFNIIGAKMENGFPSQFGLNMNDLLNNVKLVISGHYHNVSQYIRGPNKIQYVGSPYQLTFGDSRQNRGHWTLDDNLNLEFFENKSSYTFLKIQSEEIDNYSNLSDSFVICEYPASISEEDLFTLNKKIEKLNPISYKAEPRNLENIEELASENDDKTISEMSDAINVGDIVKVCEVYMNVEPPPDKAAVIKIINDIKDKIK